MFKTDTSSLKPIALAAALLCAAPAPLQADAGLTAAVVGVAFAGLIVGSTVEHEIHQSHPSITYYPTAPVVYQTAYAAPSTLARVTPIAVTYAAPIVTYAAPVVYTVPPIVTQVPGGPVAK